MKFAPYIIACVAMLAGLAILAGAANARQVYVPGFYRPNGVWVAPHYRNVPDGTAYDGTVYPNGDPYTGAVNPYTGAVVPHAYPYGTYPYQAPYAAPYGAPYAAPYAAPYVAPGSVAPAPYYGAP